MSPVIISTRKCLINLWQNERNRLVKECRNKLEVSFSIWQYKDLIILYDQKQTDWFKCQNQLECVNLSENWLKMKRKYKSELRLKYNIPTWNVRQIICPAQTRVMAAPAARKVCTCLHEEHSKLIFLCRRFFLNKLFLCGKLTLYTKSLLDGRTL